MFYSQMYAEYNRIEKQIQALQEQMNALPDGKLICTKNGTYVKYYQKLNESLHYLKKEQRWIAEKLAYKKYLSLCCDDLHAEKKAIALYLKQHKKLSPKAPQLFNDCSSYSTLLKTQFTPYSIDHQQWMQSNYQRNSSYPEHLIHPSLSGNIVRSKSEALIDMALFLKHIPYRYECALYLDDILLFPDFTILHPHTNELFYWEHFGMMDLPSYSHSAYQKLELYTSHGIIPSINLIVTFETKQNPLNSRTIDQIIQNHFM